MGERPQATVGMKILAILMAVALWGFVGISQHHLAPTLDEKRLSLAVEVKHPPPTHRIRPDPPTVQVVVEGPSHALEHITEADVFAFVDLRFRPPEGGRGEVHVSVPEGMRYTVRPETVNLIRARSDPNLRTR